MAKYEIKVEAWTSGVIEFLSKAKRIVVETDVQPEEIVEMVDHTDAKITILELDN